MQVIVAIIIIIIIICRPWPLGTLIFLFFSISKKRQLSAAATLGQVYRF